MQIAQDKGSKMLKKNGSTEGQKFSKGFLIFLLNTLTWQWLTVVDADSLETIWKHILGENYWL